MSETCIKISSSETLFSSLNEIFDNDIVRNGDTILLESDVEVMEPLVIQKRRFTIDLHQHTLYMSTTKGLRVKGGANVTFVNGRICTVFDNTSEGVLVVQGSGTVVTLGSDLILNASEAYLNVRKRGHLNIDGASVISTGSSPTILVEDPGSQFSISQGDVLSQSTSAIEVRNSGSVLIHGGKVGSSNADTPLILSSDLEASDVQISGGFLRGTILPQVLSDGLSLSHECNDEGYCEVISALEHVSIEDMEVAGNFHDLESSGIDDSFESTFEEPTDSSESISLEVAECDALDSERICTETSDNLEQSLNVEVTTPCGFTASSVNIKKKIQLYRTPSRSKAIATWRGALTIVEIGHTSPSGEDFGLVKFRIPGSGVVSTGYALVEDLVREGGLMIVN